MRLITKHTTGKLKNNHSMFAESSANKKFNGCICMLEKGSW
jgi:hypothetical protein